MTVLREQSTSNERIAGQDGSLLSSHRQLREVALIRSLAEPSIGKMTELISPPPLVSEFAGAIEASVLFQSPRSSRALQAFFDRAERLES